MGQAARTLSEKVEFQAGITEIVQLRFDTGKQVEGRFGDQFMFGLEGGRIMFVEPEVNSQLRQLGARAGDQVGITKRVQGTGKNKRTLWDVEIVDSPGEEDEPPEWAQPEAQTPPVRRTVQRAEEALTAERQHPPTVRQWNEARQRDYSQAPATVETRIERPPVATASQPASRPSGQNDTDRDQMLRCMMAAIDAARLASRYASEQGMSIGFSGEDVRAMGLSLFIGHQKAGRI